jgi:DNA mismatch repair ATPase MutS
MTHSFEFLERYCTDVKESPGGGFSFVHRLRKGVNRESHALKVAQLAGLPRETLELASRVRRQLRDERKSSRAGSDIPDTSEEELVSRSA